LIHFYKSSSLTLKMAKGKKSKKSEDSAEESDVGSVEEEPVVEKKGKKGK